MMHVAASSEDPRLMLDPRHLWAQCRGARYCNAIVVLGFAIPARADSTTLDGKARLQDSSEVAWIDGKSRLVLGRGDGLWVIAPLLSALNAGVLRRPDGCTQTTFVTVARESS